MSRSLYARLDRRFGSRSSGEERRRRLNLRLIRALIKASVLFTIRALRAYIRSTQQSVGRIHNLYVGGWILGDLRDIAVQRREMYLEPERI